VWLFEIAARVPARPGSLGAVEAARQLGVVNLTKLARSARSQRQQCEHQQPDTLGQHVGIRLRSVTVPAAAPIALLLVEDHDLLADNLVRLLEAGGDIRVVAVAATVAEAVAAAREHVPDVVIMDHRLPDGTGIDATLRIKADRPDVPVVLLTGALDPAVERAAVDAGCALALEKASSSTIGLAATVRSLVESAD
jgi:CheY-like chemotaxis protein